MNKQLQIEVLYNSRKVSMIIAYFLGLFTGAFGGHYMYIGGEARGYGVIMLITLILSLMSIFGMGSTNWALIHGLLVIGSFFHTYFAVSIRNKQIKQECMIICGEGE